MALATPNWTPITVFPDGRAAYSLVLAQTGGTNPEASQLVLIYPDGAPTTPLGTSANVVASGTTDATGLLANVTLRPGCPYQVVCPNDGTWTLARFIAPSTVGALVTSGEVEVPVG